MRKIGKEFNCISTKIRRAIGNLPSISKLNNISGSNAFIIVYLYKNKNDVYQKDIEREFGMTRSTVSSVLKLMEQKNLLFRENVNGDARLKKIVLTDVAKDYAIKVINDLDDFEKKLSKDISEDDILVVEKVLDKITENLKEV